MQRTLRIFLLATIVLVAVLFQTPVASGAGPSPPLQPTQQLVDEQPATTPATGIPASTPSADTILHAQAATVQPLPVDEPEGATVFTWLLLSLAMMLIVTLAAGDSRLRMQTPDHPEWDRALH